MQQCPRNTQLITSLAFGVAQLYQSDPSGNYNGWKATCIGANSQSATSLMKQEYKSEDPIPLAQALQLAVKVSLDV